MFENYGSAKETAAMFGTDNVIEVKDGDTYIAFKNDEYVTIKDIPASALTLKFSPKEPAVKPASKTTSTVEADVKAFMETAHALFKSWSTDSEEPEVTFLVGEDTTEDCKKLIAMHFKGTEYASDKKWKRTSKKKVGATVVREFESKDGVHKITVTFDPATSKLQLRPTASSGSSISASTKSAVALSPAELEKRIADFASTEDDCHDHRYEAYDCYYCIADETVCITPIWYWKKYKHMADFITGERFAPGVLRKGGCDSSEVMEGVFSPLDSDPAITHSKMTAAGFVRNDKLC